MMTTRVVLQGDAANSYVCRGKGIEPLHADEDSYKQGGETTRTGQCELYLEATMQEVQRPHDQVDCVGRARLVESCESRDESPCSNLGRVNPRVKGRHPQRKEREQLGREQL